MSSKISSESRINTTHGDGSPINAADHGGIVHSTFHLDFSSHYDDMKRAISETISNETDDYNREQLDELKIALAAAKTEPERKEFLARLA